MEESKGRDWSKGDLRKSDTIGNQGKNAFWAEGSTISLEFC